MKQAWIFIVVAGVALAQAPQQEIQEGPRVPSPSGDRAAFISRQAGDNLNFLCVTKTVPQAGPVCAQASFQGETYSGPYSQPTWSPDGRYVFFVTFFEATTRALARYDTRSDTAKIISNANVFALVQGGRWRGRIVADVRTMKEAPGADREYPNYDYYVLDEDGTILARVGDENEDLPDVLKRVEQMK